MTIETAFKAAVLAALAGAPGLTGRLNRVGDGEVERAPVPYAWTGEVIAGEWGGKARPGRELRLGVTIADRGTDAAGTGGAVNGGGTDRLAVLAGAAEAALLALPRTLTLADGAGWETGGVVVTRVRLHRRGDGLRLAQIDLRLRAWRAV